MTTIEWIIAGLVFALAARLVYRWHQDRRLDKIAQRAIDAEERREKGLYPFSYEDIEDINELHPLVGQQLEREHPKPRLVPWGFNKFLDGEIIEPRPKSQERRDDT